MPMLNVRIVVYRFRCCAVAPVYGRGVFLTLPIIEDKIVPRLGVHVDVESCLAVICDIQRADIELTACVLDVLERPVPALADEPIVRGKGRQLGLRGQLGECPRIQKRPVVVPEIDVRLLGRLFFYILRQDWLIV